MLTTSPIPYIHSLTAISGFHRDTPLRWDALPVNTHMIHGLTTLSGIYRDTPHCRDALPLNNLLLSCIAYRYTKLASIELHCFPQDALPITYTPNSYLTLTSQRVYRPIRTPCQSFNIPIRPYVWYNDHVVWVKLILPLLIGNSF